MAGVNKVILVGNLGKDPKISTLTSGSKVASFSLATSESWKDKQTGERRERTEWHNVVIFNENVVNVAAQYLKKGSKAYVEGQLKTRKYVDTAGVERYVTEVVIPNFGGALVLLDKADRPAPDEGSYGTTRTRTAAGAGALATGGGPDPDDEIPF